MSLHAEQIFVKHSDITAVADQLKMYVKQYKNEYHQTSKIKLEGTQQVLKFLIKSKRTFNLLCKDEWVSIWEINNHGVLADPFIAQVLSAQLKTETIWMELSCDYNIWAYQIFKSGKLMKELFEPKSYFIDGNPESDKSEDYGFCIDQAEKFNKKRNLPYFLDTMATINRKPSLAKKILTVTCRIKR